MSRFVSGTGKIGIQLPVQGDGRGRLVRTSGNDQLQKVISLNLQPLDSANPYQADIGLGGQVIFAIADVNAQQDLRRRINALFRNLQLQDRARLAGPPTFEVDSEKQDMNCTIDYVNLEEQKAETMELGFSLRSTEVKVA